jgi:carbon storage regulator
MLVLTRKPGESLVVPDLGLTITVVSIKGNNSVRLGFEAPSGLAIHRQEVFDCINGRAGTEEGKAEVSYPEP